MLKGLHAVCGDCVVTKRDQYMSNKPPVGTVYQIRVEGRGFGHTFATRDPAVAEKWPAVGLEVDVVCPLETDWEGKLRMGEPVFHAVGAVSVGSTATAAAKARTGAA